MPIYFPKKVVLNWYQYDASFSIDLMISFVDGIEKQAAYSIANYRTKQSEDGHQGLDDSSWDLENIFGEYFPSLQRRSAFLTVWSYLEHQLDQLCLFYQSERKLRLSFTDLSGKGIDRSTDYLEKVAGLHGLKASGEWNALKTLQRIRNVITHDDSRLRDHGGEPKKGIISDMKKVGFLTGDEEIAVAEGFLSQVVHTCNDYFKLIEKAIYAEQGFTSPAYKKR
ncbi:MAG TPA: hypothetical protein VIK39_12835 [Candidatus Angelobacter sp.]